MLDAEVMFQSTGKTSIGLPCPLHMKNDLDQKERIQRRATKKINSVENMEPMITKMFSLGEVLLRDT